MNEQQHIQGFTLIELLVAVLILSVGLLGLASLQITGMRSVNNSSSYTQATLAINDIVERIRANPDALYLVANSAADIDCTVMPNPYCSEYNDGVNVVDAQACLGTQLAAYDLNVWFCGENMGGGNRSGALSDILPQVSATIDRGGFACAQGTPCTISLTWQELNPDHSDLNGDGVIDETVPRNLTLTIVP